jgi:hypothetical protein
LGARIQHELSVTHSRICLTWSSSTKNSISQLSTVGGIETEAQNTTVLMDLLCPEPLLYQFNNQTLIGCDRNGFALAPKYF